MTCTEVVQKDHYYRDEGGQWWYDPPVMKRKKATLKTCPVCDRLFPTLETRPHKRCSWTCSNRANAPLSAEKRTGPKSHLWKGGVHQRDDGYVRVSCPGHPAASNNTVLEHRLVMERKLGRYLTDDETVHHKNGVKNDNRIDNLELWTSNHPAGQRVEDLVVWAKEMLAKYDHVGGAMIHISDQPLRVKDVVLTIESK